MKLFYTICVLAVIGFSVYAVVEARKPLPPFPVRTFIGPIKPVVVLPPKQWYLRWENKNMAKGLWIEVKSSTNAQGPFVTEFWQPAYSNAIPITLSAHKFYIARFADFDTNNGVITTNYSDWNTK